MHTSSYLRKVYFDLVDRHLPLLFFVDLFSVKTPSQFFRRENLTMTVAVFLPALQ